MKPTYLPHLHALRGIAILTILGAHAWSFMIFWTGPLDEGLKPLFQITESLFHGSTLYFALVSGVLFSKVLSGKSWPSFFKSKCKQNACCKHTEPIHDGPCFSQFIFENITILVDISRIDGINIHELLIQLLISFSIPE